MNLVRSRGLLGLNETYKRERCVNQVDLHWIKHALPGGPTWVPCATSESKKSLPVTRRRGRLVLGAPPPAKASQPLRCRTSSLRSASGSSSAGLCAGFAGNGVAHCLPHPQPHDGTARCSSSEAAKFSHRPLDRPPARKPAAPAQPAQSSATARRAPAPADF